MIVDSVFPTTHLLKRWRNEVPEIFTDCSIPSTFLFFFLGELIVQSKIRSRNGTKKCIVISIEKELERKTFCQSVLPSKRPPQSLTHTHVCTHTDVERTKKKGRTQLTMGERLVLVVREPSDCTVASRLNGVGIGWRWFLTLLSELTQTAPKRWQLGRHLASNLVTRCSYCPSANHVHFRIKKRREVE